MKDCVKRRFSLRQGARKKRKVDGVLALPPSGDKSLDRSPLLTNSLPQCVQTCVRLLNLPCKITFYLVSDIPVANHDFWKPSKGGWEGLDVRNFPQCVWAYLLISFGTARPSHPVRP
jgi:hypothetical protein